MRSIFDAHLVNPPFGDPGVYVDFRFQKRAILFDLGDNAPLAPRQLIRLTHAFVSHAHMDHFIGFDRVLRTCLGRESGIRLFGPPGFVGQVERRLGSYTWDRVDRYDPGLVLDVTEIDAGGRTRGARFRAREAFVREDLPAGRAPDGVLVDEAAFRVRCALLDHRTPCLGYALEERTHVNVWRTRLQAMGLEVGPWVGLLKTAAIEGVADDAPILAAWTEGERRVERPLRFGDVKHVLEFVPGRKLCYITDVLYHPRNVERMVALAEGADLLFIESVFLDADAPHAEQKQHLTAKQAGTIARLAGARLVEPFHFSPRYAGRSELLRAELEAARGGEARGGEAHGGEAHDARGAASEGVAHGPYAVSAGQEKIAADGESLH